MNVKHFRVIFCAFFLARGGGAGNGTVDKRVPFCYTFFMEEMGFLPFVCPDSHTLILGSFPSVKSREEGFYYGNRQNRFWKILAQTFSAPLPTSVEEKKALLRAHRIALWDIVLSCDIVGSMDKDIRNPVIADVPALLNAYPIRRILTNGGTAHALFVRHYPALAPLCLPLPSTSPANVRLDPQVWQDALLVSAE